MDQSCAERVWTATATRRCRAAKAPIEIREPAGYRHGQVAAEIAHVLATHVKANGLGTVFAAESGFTLFEDPDTVRLFVCRVGASTRGTPANARLEAPHDRLDVGGLQSSNVREVARHNARRAPGAERRIRGEVRYTAYG
jgi:hypothetical protein